MRTAEMRSEPAIANTIEMKLEVIVIPVSNVDRAKRFYSNLGWRLDIDYSDGDDYRVIQFTPPGSGCSVIFGKNVTTATPGSMRGLHPTGKPTLSKMMKKGWLEQDGAEGSYRITPAGRVALKAKIPAERTGTSLAGSARGQGSETLGHNDE